MQRLSILSYRMIRCRPLSFLLIAFLLAVSLTSGNMLTSVLREEAESVRLIRKLDRENYVYFQIEDQRSAEWEQRNDAENAGSGIYLTEAERESQMLRQLKGVRFQAKQTDVFGACHSDALLTQEPYCTVYAQEHALLALLQIPLQKGTWFGSESLRDAVPAVVAQHHNRWKTGDRFALDEDGDGSDDITFEVCGILPEHSHLFSFCISGDMLCSMDLIQPDPEEPEGCPLILCETEKLPAAVLPREVSLNSVIFFDNDLTEADMQENMRIMKQYGSVSDRDMLQTGTEQHIRQQLFRFVPISILFLLTGIIGLLSISILNFMLYKRHFAVFFLCGAEWRQCIAVNLIYAVWSVLAAFLLAFTFLHCASVHEPAAIEYRISPVNLLFSGLLCILIVCLSAFSPYLLMRRTSPKEILTENAD